MKKKRIATLILALFIIASFIQSKSKEEKELKPILDSYFEKQLNNQSGASNTEYIPGLSVIITKKDSILYKGNFGSSDLEKKSLISETTVFDIASVSKQFTGMAIALLEEKGKIKMNDKIVKYLPDLPELMNDITIYQLVHHTSGIRDWPTLFGLKGWQLEDSLSLDDIYEMMKKQKSLNFNPGTEFSYSNSNYNLLAKIVEAVTETTFNSWMHDNIFAPLEMNNTFFVDNNQKEDIIADSYLHKGKKYQPFSNNLNAPGSSSINSSSLDMSKWMINFSSKKLGANSVFDKITEKGSLSTNKTIDYGYGLYITEMKNKKVLFHDGVWGAYRSVTVIFPEESIGLVILSNNGTLNLQKMMIDVFDVLFSDVKKEKSKESKLDNQEINDEFFALCAGKYEQVDDKACYLTFFKDGDEYFLNMYNKDYKLYAKSDSVYYVKESTSEFIFHLKNGEVNSHTLASKKSGNNYLALRVEEKKETNINYDNLTGTFYSKELDVKYKIGYVNDELKIQSPVFQNDIIIEYSEDLTFSSNSGLIQSLSFIKENGAITSFVINNPRAKNLLFEKLN